MYTTLYANSFVSLEDPRDTPVYPLNATVINQTVTG